MSENSTQPAATQVRTAYPHGWFRRPTDDVAASWLRQVTVVAIDGQVIRLQAIADGGAKAGATREAPSTEETAWPFASSVLIIGAVRGPSVSYPDEARASQQELLRQLETFGVGARPAWTVDGQRRWAEPAAVAFRHTDEETAASNWRHRALDTARRMGIDTVVEVDAVAWTVRSLGEPPNASYSRVAAARTAVTYDDEHRCPMLTDPTSGEYCSMRGGPWTSSSIHAATGWVAHRDLLIEAVGCDTCEGVRYQLSGRVFTGGGPIPLVPLPMATRWLEPDERRLEDADDDDPVFPVTPR